MKIEISYKNSVIGSLSAGESLAIHLNGQKLTEDLVVRVVEDTVYTIKAGTYILHSNIISNVSTNSTLTNLDAYVYDGTSYVLVGGSMLSFQIDGVEIHSGGFNYITCNGSAWVAHYTLDGESILSEPISYNESYMRITVLEDTTVTKEYYDVFTTNTDKKLSAPTITTDGTVVTITDTSGLATNFNFYHNGVGLFQTSETVVNVSEMVLENFGAGTYNITVTALADGYEESEPSNAVEYVVEVKQLSAPTISISSETDDTLIISLVNNNDVSGRYWVYVNGEVAAAPFTDISTVTFTPISSFFNVGTNTIYATMTADGYEESEPSNAVEYVVEESEPTTPTLISFTIHNGDTLTYYAEEGMTWEEWCESEHNTGYNADGDASSLYTASGGYVFARGNAYITDGGGISNRVKSTDLIKKDYAYSIYFD